MRQQPAPHVHRRRLFSALGGDSRRRLPNQRRIHVLQGACAGYAEDLVAPLTAAAGRRYRDGESRPLSNHIEQMGAGISRKQAKKAPGAEEVAMRGDDDLRAAQQCAQHHRDGQAG